MTAPRLSKLQRHLLAWAERDGRDLPWRHTRDPWAILVSEVMLQQTQVARVIPAWSAFLLEFPTPTVCANADQSAVVTAWHGMGFNRRARNLHQCAMALRDTRDGTVPGTLAELVALPGVGPYTARAVMTFAFEQAVGVVDVNAARVHARIAGRALTNNEVQAAADAATPVHDAWRWNQAVLDLGATICTKRAPNCDECPVARDCAWRARNNAQPDPAEGSARIPKPQSRFEGSDRQGRGRLINALRAGAVSSEPTTLAEVMGWPDDPTRATRVAQSLVDDGLMKWEEHGNIFCLQQ